MHAKQSRAGSLGIGQSKQKTKKKNKKNKMMMVVGQQQKMADGQQTREERWRAEYLS